MERADEASELASLAGSADSEATRPLPSYSEGLQQTVSPPPPATGSSAASGSPAPPLEGSNLANFADKSSVTNPLIRTASVSEDYLEFQGRPGHIEKRFPVDRKKLERLITVGGHNNETAEEFFKRVQDTTRTLILWPSRLKIGAKSKKDPQVKVVGVAANIQQAREMILADLDAKSTRITLKIEVAYSEHSHVIGKEGVNIKKVHNDTNCHIHFPDSNRSAYGGERSNQVSITGQMESLEVARRKIRDLLPAAVTFSLPLPTQYDSNLAKSPDVQQIMQQYNVVIHLKPQPHQYSMMAVVRGTMKTLDGLKLAVSSLVECFTGDIMLIPVVSLNLDIAPQHYRTLIGSGGGNIRKIMAETSTTIQFPDPQSRYTSSHVAVTGEVDCVFRARDQLLGCLPAVLMFDVHESDDNILSSSLIGDLMQKLDLFISVKPKKGQLQSVIIKSIEQNIQCMYRARTSLLACSYQPVSSPQPLPPTSSPRATPPPTKPPPTKPQLKETPSKVMFSVPLNSTPDKEDGKEHREVLERRVSFKDLVEGKAPPKASPLITSSTKEEGGEEEGGEGKLGKGDQGEEPASPPPTDIHSHSSSNIGQQLRPNATPPVRPTTKQFLDWERKREQAQQAMKSKVEPDKVRYPTAKYAGNLFSESMPVGAQRGGPGWKTPPSPTSTPQGLSSINRTSYQALMNQATQERAQMLHSDQDLYRSVADLSTLLHQLGLEHYEARFEEEEVDLDTFLTMTEADLKEVGVTTLGARRKLQIAISEMKKQQGNPPPVSRPRSTASLPRSSASLGRSSGGRNMYRSTTGSLVLSPPPGAGVGINRSASLSRDTKFSGMSRSGRF